MKKYIIINHNRLKKLPNKIKRKLRYMSQNTRINLLISPSLAILYKLNEEKMRYEPILHKQPEAELQLDYTPSHNTPFVTLFYPLKNYGFEFPEFYSLGNSYDYAKFFSEPFKQFLENILAVVKLLSTNIKILINANKKIIRIIFENLNNASKIENIKNLFSNSQIAIKNMNIHNEHRLVIVELHTTSSVYDTQKINKHFAIPYKNVEEIKKIKKIENIELEMYDHGNFIEFIVLKKLSKTDIFFETNLRIEPIDLALNEIDQDFVKIANVDLRKLTDL